ncbi:glycerophosphoryl diester phosphodiesterase [Microbacterium resistens]|uniref:glycerophosphodiester phosphodiesterase n=1 Tax=Microbacterium resistens TaxID=156977 RepID=A0ABU1SCF8_9MICO|nr:glycerophosphodiester phosphodiesterase family protein [Microbacterium resistens]MDR6867302.1 glycerophosphoryl diester phosphodiesterase [Microbacterium resistens]
MTRQIPLVIGHRGAPGYRPEHTRASYELAIGMGVDAVEPDVVPTRDGVLVVRHENEISGTTDVADHPEFADRRRRGSVDGEELTGWFAEDFTWAELSDLRCRERLPLLRPGSAAFDGVEPILRLSDVLDLVRRASAERSRAIGVVVEIKHATSFAALGFDVGDLVERELRASGWADGVLPLWIESFEAGVLDRIRDRGLAAELIYLIEAAGAPFDLVSLKGADEDAPVETYAEQISPGGLARLAGRVDGISVDKRILLDRPGLPAEAHAEGLSVLTWTCRPENAFLDGPHRRAGGDGAFGDFAEEWARIAATGVDGVFVDHPDLGVAAFRSRPAGATVRP